jgi:hypothetical protein
MSRRLEDRLLACGCQMGAVDFRDLLAETLHNLYRNWNDEDLMHRPEEALRYCRAGRHAAKCLDLPDELILRALSGMRKHVRN